MKAFKLFGDACDTDSSSSQIGLSGLNCTTGPNDLIILVKVVRSLNLTTAQYLLNV